MKAKITFTIEAPCECTMEQFEEWIDHQLFGRSIDQNNPCYEAEQFFDVAEHIGDIEKSSPETELDDEK